MMLKQCFYISLATHWPLSELEELEDADRNYLAELSETYFRAKYGKK